MLLSRIYIVIVIVHDFALNESNIFKIARVMVIFPIFLPDEGFYRNSRTDISQLCTGSLVKLRQLVVIYTYIFRLLTALA